ncbi:ABC transporter ATP-binding protein/permease [Mycoplasmatota bacterium]|nr:ABC transporter ATP-binding protein/permease [Mycoplasmatota bacterium]
MKDFKDNTRDRSDKEVIKRLLAYMKPYTKQLIVVFILMIISVLVQLLPSLMLGLTIDNVSSDAERSEKITYLIIVAVIFFVLMIGGNWIAYIQSMMLQKIGQQTVVKVREDVFQHIENLSIEQINELPVGKLVTRVTNDTNAISEMYTSVSVDLIKNILYLIGILVMIMVINIKMALIVIIAMPIVILASAIFRKYSRATYRQVRANVSEVNAYLSENLSGMKITQIFNQEDKKNQEFKQRNQDLRKSYLREILVFGIYRPSIYGISAVALVATLYIGYQNVVAGVMSAGFLYAFYNYVSDFFQPVQQIAEQFNTLQNAFASAEKIFDVLDTKPMIEDKKDAIEIESFTGSIEFKDVWFSYIPDEWILKGISFKVNPGDTVAFVGATGSGKTTILNLIVRNYDIQKGQILIDGIDIKDIKRSSLRKQIGQMLQDVFLFSGSIENNISLNNEDIPFQEIKAASEYVGAHTFIDKLPDGYKHVVLERGNNFSSGQRQLISFARAIVYKPSLMILDEATANIDSETEELIQASLEKMMNISTMLIVAHRLSTIQHSDKIIVMQKGEIKEMGSHQALLKEKGLYYKLYQLQYDETPNK